MKHPVRDLKTAASTTLFKGWGVTPAMKEELRRRIERIDSGKEPAPVHRRPMRAPFWAAGGIAVACVITIIGLQAMPGPTAEENSAAPGPPSYTNATYSRSRPATEMLNAAKVTLTAKLTDATGNNVNGTAAYSVVTYDQAGTSLPATGPIPVAESHPGQKIILNAEYTLKVKDARSAVERLQNLALSLNGYVADAVVQQSGGGYSGRVVLRIPSRQYGQAVGSLKEVGEITHERQWTQDVTDQYTDMENRLKTLQEFEGQLRTLAEKAANFDDWLKLSRQINETRVEIDNLKGRLKLLANQVDYSTISVSLTQSAEPAAPHSEGLGAQTLHAFKRSVHRLVTFARAAVVGSAASIPFAIPAALSAGIAWAFIRRRKAN